MDRMNTDSRLVASRVARITGLAAAATLALACGGSTAVWTYAPLGPSPSAGASGSPTTSGSPSASASPSTSGSPSASGSATANVIQLEETSSLQITQNGQPLSQLQLTVGQTYTFQINNTAGFTHDFYLGPPDKLSGNDTTGLPGVPVNENGVQEFTWTVTPDASTWQFACTVPGHYNNMHGSLVLQVP
jgi:uncharacterized cupredoxin-like copper-binding protein